MASIVPSFFKIDKESEDAKSYLEASLQRNGTVQPILTFYQQEKPVFTVKFPATIDIEAKLENFAKVAWLNGCIRSNGVRFVVDSMIPLKNELDEEYNQDLMLIFFCNKLGCFVEPKCYVFSRDTNSVMWVDKNIDEHMIMDSQPAIINMLAAQFFFSHHTLPFPEYIEYLEDQGFTFEYHEGFDQKLVEYAQANLY